MLNLYRLGTFGKVDDMAKLTREQKQFLKTHSISMSQVFDATGLKKAAYYSEMKDLDLVIAYGVTPCNAAGHTLRLRRGACAQCNTHSLSFLRRYYESGEVYVATSAKTSLVKIGMAQEAQARMRNLNIYGYGGAKDWKVHFSQSCDKAGEVEYAAQSSLDKHRVYREYVRTGRTESCLELFDCSAAVATKAVKAAIENAGGEDTRKVRVKKKPPTTSGKGLNTKLNPAAAWPFPVFPRK